MRNHDDADKMTKRMTISVDDDVYAVLQRLADEEVRSVANLAAALVTKSVREIEAEKAKQKDK